MLLPLNYKTKKPRVILNFLCQLINVVVLTHVISWIVPSPSLVYVSVSSVFLIPMFAPCLKSILYSLANDLHRIHYPSMPWHTKVHKLGPSNAKFRKICRTLHYLAPAPFPTSPANFHLTSCQQYWKLCHSNTLGPFIFKTLVYCKLLHLHLHLPLDISHRQGLPNLLLCFKCLPQCLDYGRHPSVYWTAGLFLLE